MLRRYEIIFIAHADLSDDQLTELIERYKKIITDSKGVIVKIEKWGTRKLAYEIKKQTKGTYVLADFIGKVNIIPEIERNFKIDDKILKFLTVNEIREVFSYDRHLKNVPVILKRAGILPTSRKGKK